mgnify:CR=1 FL=1
MYVQQNKGGYIQIKIWLSRVLKTFSCEAQLNTCTFVSVRLSQLNFSQFGQLMTTYNSLLQLMTAYDSL